MGGLSQSINSGVLNSGSIHLIVPAVTSSAGLLPLCFMRPLMVLPFAEITPLYPFFLPSCWLKAPLLLAHVWLFLTLVFFWTATTLSAAPAAPSSPLLSLSTITTPAGPLAAEPSSPGAGAPADSASLFVGAAPLAISPSDGWLVLLDLVLSSFSAACL